MTITVTGWGVAVPDGRVTQNDAASHAVEMWGDMIGRGPAITALYRRSGVETRHSVLINPSRTADRTGQSFYRPAKHADDLGPSTLIRMQRYEEEATRLGSVAAHRALESANLPSESISHLVTASCSGFASPGFDLGLLEMLPLRRDVVRTHVGFMGCHAAFNAWRVATAFAECNHAARVLVCCVELCTLHQQYSTSAEQIVANSLFADGAAAFVAHSPQESSVDDWKLVDQQSFVVPQTRELMTWRIGNHGFQMTLSPLIPEVIQTTLKPWISRWLSSHGLQIEDVGSWAVHPGGPRILNACESSLELAKDVLQPSRTILEQFGNMSSPTIMFILDKLRREHARRPCVSLAFGPGITIEGALWQ